MLAAVAVKIVEIEPYTDVLWRLEYERTFSSPPKKPMAGNLPKKQDLVVRRRLSFRTF